MFACDAGMGSSAMGASVLRKKIQAAGHGEVTVVNKAISNLRDDYDLVVTHQDLTDRARQKTPSAIQVSVDNFMGSPRYDEIVELIDQSTAGCADAAASAGVDGDVLAGSRSCWAVGDEPGRRDHRGRSAAGRGRRRRPVVRRRDARAGDVGVDVHGQQAGHPARHQRGEGAIRRTGISFVRYDEPMDWNGKPAEFVVGIAGAGDDHLALLSRIAETFTDEEAVRTAARGRDGPTRCSRSSTSSGSTSASRAELRPAGPSRERRSARRSR